MPAPKRDRAWRIALDFYGEDVELAQVEDLASRVRVTIERRKRNAAKPVKVCPACERRLPANAFGESTVRPDGLQGVCLGCDAARAAQRRASNKAGQIPE